MTRICPRQLQEITIKLEGSALTHARKQTEVVEEQISFISMIRYHRGARVEERSMIFALPPVARKWNNFVFASPALS